MNVINYSALLLFIFFSNNLSATEQKTSILQYGKSDLSQMYFEELQRIDPSRIINAIDLKSSPVPTYDRTTYIILGLSALKMYLQSEVNSFAIVLFVSKSTYYHTIKAFEHTKYSEGEEVDTTNITAVFSEPSPVNQFRLIKKYYPNDVNIGVILSPATNYLESEINQIKLTKTQVDFAYKYKKSDINKTLNQLKKSDVILAIRDSLIWNRHNIKNLVLSAYRKEQPIFGYDKNLVKAGALATTYSDISNIVFDTNMILIHLDKESILPLPTYATHFNIAVNEKVRKSFGFSKSNLPAPQEIEKLNEIVL